MSNIAINNKQQELQQTLAGARSSQATSSKVTSIDPSLGLTSASALHLGDALNGAAAAVNPTTLNMLSKQKQELDTEQQRFLQIIETLSSQVESLSQGTSLATGDPNAFANLLSQRYLNESSQTQGFTEAYSAQLGPHTDLGLFSMLAQESKKLDGTNDDENGKKADDVVEGSGDEAQATSKQPTNSNSPQGCDAIFAAAGNMQKLAQDSENSMIASLERQIQIMEEQLQSMETMMKFMEEEGKYLSNYLSDPNYQNLEALINFLKQNFTGDPSVENMLDQLSELGDILENLFGSDFGEKLWQDIASNFKLSCLGNQTINEYLSGLMGQVSGDPSMFQEFQRYGEKYFEETVERLITQLSEMIMLYDVLTGKGSNAIFDMESILMNLEEIAIKNNAKQSDQRKEMADAVQQGLDSTMKELIDAQQKIAKAEHESHHHGIFGAISDFFKSIINKIADILKGVADIVTGHPEAAGQEFKKAFDGFAKFFEGIAKAVEQIVDGIKNGDFNEVLKGFTTLATDAVMCALLGPVGAMMLTGTSFGKDIKNLTKIVVDAVGALGQVIVAGFEKLAGAFGDKKAELDADANLKNCKKLGEDIITNPQFQTLMDIVAIVMIVAAAVSQQYWLAGIMVVLLVANDFGGTQWVIGKIAEAVEWFLTSVCGMKDSDKLKDWCKVIADVIVIVAVMVTGSVSGAFETGAEQALSTATDVAEEGIEMTTFSSNVVEESTETASQSAEESQGAARKAFNKAVDGAKALLRNNGTALMTFGTALGSTSLGIDLAKAASKKDDKELQEILEIIQMCISIVCSLAGGVGMGLQEDVNTLTQNINGAIRKASSTLADYLENNMAALTRLNTYIQGGGMLLNGGADVGKGLMQELAAKLIQEVANYQKDMTLFEATNKDNNAGIQQNNQHLKTLMQEFEQMVKNFDAPSKAGEGVEQALLQNS
ncbi:MAG: hypothetical protein KDK56_09215 [Simkania sp.]|nr:hypothetical protein [Simkania sp.]MCP5489572.1 hypothetical protein [Chlamydiales bacterium]